MDPTRFETHPEPLQALEADRSTGDIATLVMAVDDDHPHRPGYELKLNSYDLGVDIELADAIQRLRFEHPEVQRVVVIERPSSTASSARARTSTCSAARRTAFKVNFCKFTNETRLYLEDASRRAAASHRSCALQRHHGRRRLRARARVRRDRARRRRQLARSSFPETPLLAVLPGTGGLTRLVDKRKVRRDLADVFCTHRRGHQGQARGGLGPRRSTSCRAAKWDETVAERAEGARRAADGRRAARRSRCRRSSRSVTDERDRVHATSRSRSTAPARTATLVVRGPDAPPTTPTGVAAAGAAPWALRAFRELDDALLAPALQPPRHRRGHRAHDAATPALVLAARRGARASATTGFAREVRLLQRRVLKRLDNTARSFFAVADAPDSCFAGVAARARARAPTASTC